MAGQYCNDLTSHCMLNHFLQSYRFSCKKVERPNAKLSFTQIKISNDFRNPVSSQEQSLESDWCFCVNSLVSATYSLCDKEHKRVFPAMKTEST